MGKKANASRKALFDSLKQDGRLDVPAIRVRKRRETKSKSQEIVQFEWCCEIKHAGNLPSGFRRCIDCPLDGGPDGC